MAYTRTSMDEMPEHLRIPYDEVVASHSGPDGIIHELEDGRFLDPSYMLVFARETGRAPDPDEFRTLISLHAADTKAEARYIVENDHE